MTPMQWAIVKRLVSLQRDSLPFIINVIIDTEVFRTIPHSHEWLSGVKIKNNIKG